MSRSRITALPMPRAIFDARVEGAVDPTIDVANPLFSWTYSRTIAPMPTEVRLFIAATEATARRMEAPVWDSGVLTSTGPRVEYAGPALRSREEYWWRVGAKLTSGAWTWSAPSRMRTGILAPDRWEARWIGRSKTPDRLLNSPSGLSVEVAVGETSTREFTFHEPVGMVSADVSAKDPDARGVLELVRIAGASRSEVIASWQLDDSWGRFFSWWGHLERPLTPGTYALRLRVTKGKVNWTLDADGLQSLCVGAAEQPAFVLRKEFQIDRPVRSATMFATGLGYHRVTINGQTVDSAVLDPAVTDYDKRVLYNRTELSDLGVGTVTIEIELGHGYFGTTGANIWGWHAAPWSHDPIAIAELDIEFEDGQRDVVGTDGSWIVLPSAVTRDALYEGEAWDLRWDPQSAASSVAIVVEGPRGSLRVQDQPRIVTHSVSESPLYLTISPSEILLDVRSTIAGWIELTCSARPYSELEIVYGELIDDVVAGVRNSFIDGRPQVDRLHVGADGRVSGWSPRYTYKGFRFVRIRGEEIRVESLKAIEVHSDVESAGEFKSDIDLIDWIDRATRRTLLNNLQGIPTDTPVHEKNGWTGDGHLIARAAMYQFNMESFYRKWLRDFRDAQDHSGGIPVIVPTPGWGRVVCPVFSGAYPILTWDHYLHYGDRRVLSENLDGVVNYARHLMAELSVDGIWEGYSWGDWMSPGYDYAPEGSTLAATSFCIESLRKTEKIATALGRDDLAGEMGAKVVELRSLFIERFFDAKDCRFRSKPDEEYRQGSNVLALAFDLVPEEAKEAVVSRLVDDIMIRRNGHLNTGAPSTRHLLPVLSSSGRDDVAVEILLQRTQPSWGFWYERGGDTLWEKWGPEARSRNHYFFGAVSQWIRERVGGLAIERPGGSTVIFNPIVDVRVPAGECSVVTVYGDVACKWNLLEGHLIARFDVPPGCSVRIADRFLGGDGMNPLVGPGSHALRLSLSGVDFNSCASL